MNKKLVAALALAAASFAAVAADASKPEGMIEIRQSGYTFMAWNMGKIKANLAGNYNKDQVLAAAKTIAAIANSGMGALYAPGTDKSVGNHKTHVKPELFTEKEEVGKLAKALATDANELERIAATGDAAAVKAQMGKVGEDCKACHDKYKMKD